MKKQINPSINAHLIRGAFYVLLLLAVCAIRFALAGLNGGNSTAAVDSAPASAGQFHRLPPDLARIVEPGTRNRNLQVTAATWTVQSSGDGAANAANCPGGGCRLRDALAAANNGDTINFDPAVTGSITLSNGELLVNDSITISGPGANVLSVDANHASRVFHIVPGMTVTIFGLTITNGSIAPVGLPGGGGIYNEHASLTLSSCTVSNNSVTGGNGGGGIYSDGSFFGPGGASLTINDSTISSNSATNSGGGIYNYGEHGTANLAVNNSTFDNNSAGGGGGIFNDGRGRIDTVFSFGATVFMSNSTLSNNSATDGGGIFNFVGFTGTNSGGYAAVHVTNSTFSGNSASNGAGGIKNGVGANGGAVEINLGGTILKAGLSGANIVNTSGGLISSGGYNLSSDSAGGFLTQAGDQINTDPRLGPLQNNGGPTFTYALCTGVGVPDASCTGTSPAIDMGNPSFTPSPANYDQRGAGYPRVVNGRIDIGAFEVQASPSPSPTATATFTPTSTATATATFTPTSSATATYTPTPTVTATFTPTPTPTPCDGIIFTNPTFITINDRTSTPAPASLYPTNIVVSGMSGSITKVTVKLNDITHGRPADIDMLLVGPGGQSARIMSDTGGCCNGISHVTLTLDDFAANPLPVFTPAPDVVTGTYRPANYNGNDGNLDAFPPPSPEFTPIGGSALSVFNGANPNGTWSLYIVDDQPGSGATNALGSIAGGWELTISTDTCATPSPTPTPTATFTPTPTATATFTPTATAT
ncbi:MAG TPA: choice-of-anchor Q domain-containing protein, partial [Candidatus Babeliales bacterium]|nr:choice-of-anchor Q domain-containing protein [Candidatus Babeliales bacterium]